MFWDETGTLLAPALRSDHVPFLAKRGNCTTLTATIGRLTPALGEYLQDLPSLEKHGWPRTVKHAVTDVRTCACLLRCTLRCWVWIREAEGNPNTILHVADTGAPCRFRAQCRSAGRSRLPCRVRQRVRSPRASSSFLYVVRVFRSSYAEPYTWRTDSAHYSRRYREAVKGSFAKSYDELCAQSWDWHVHAVRTLTRMLAVSSLPTSPHPRTYLWAPLFTLCRSQLL